MNHVQADRARHAADAETTRQRAAVLIDRDGTLIDDVHYIANPDHVVLRPGATELVRRCNERGVPVVVITNQSGIARGLITEAQYHAVRAAVDAHLAAHGARIDATYHCPHHPDVTGPCDCRKPGVALYEQAARELRLDLARSAFVGDRWRDVAPARHFGGRGILVPSPDTPADEVARAEREVEVAPSLFDVAEWLIDTARGVR